MSADADYYCQTCQKDFDKVLEVCPLHREPVCPGCMKGVHSYCKGEAQAERDAEAEGDFYYGDE